LAIKEGELERKKQKDITDAAAKADQLEIERLRIETQAEIEGTKIGTQVAKDRAEGEAKYEAEGIRLGIDMGRSLREAKNSNQAPTKKEGE
jgi:hypothetical protein